MQWANASTLELIQLLAERAASAPLLLVCTARTDFSAESHFSRITLDPLDGHRSRTMVERLAHQKTLPEQSIAIIVERTGGVPLFVEELKRAVLESGDVTHAKGAIPVTLQDSLLARLDRLGGARVRRFRSAQRSVSSLPTSCYLLSTRQARTNSDVTCSR